jgi:hypothetical protein
MKLYIRDDQGWQQWNPEGKDPSEISISLPNGGQADIFIVPGKTPNESDVLRIKSMGATVAVN